MDELVAFLRAALDRDEQAVAAILRRQPVWRVDPEPWETNGVGIVTQQGESVAVAIGSYAAEHITRWDPARVLAEVQAKRRIIDLLLVEMPDGDPDGWTHDVVRALAQPYAGQDGWREEWGVAS